jgi:LacI family transcriptional regulator
MGHRAATVLLDILEEKEDGLMVGQMPALIQLRDSVCPPQAAR